MMHERVKTALLGLAGMVPFVLLVGFANGWDWLWDVVKAVSAFFLVLVCVGMFALGVLAVIGAFLGDFVEGARLKRG